MDAKTLCLGMLTQGEASGYEIRKAFEDGPFHHFFDVGYGSIYPALGRLDEAGLVSCRAEAQAKRPDKKVYSITPEGRQAFVEALMEPPAPDKLRSEFLFLLFFADLLPADHVERVVEGRLAEVRAALDRMEACAFENTGKSHDFVHGYGLAIYRAMADYLEQNRHLLREKAASAVTAEPEQEGAAL
jgi:DNA-binding PadR family transcriptional regulator